MDINKAQKIIDLFGPCTTLGECYTAQELLDEFNEDNAPGALCGPVTDEQFVQIQLDMEAVRMDGECAACHIGPNHDKVVIESDCRYEQIKQRLVAAGLL